MSLLKRRKIHKPNPLLKEIAAAKTAMEVAYSNFENVLDPDLIDSYIYEVNAVQKRYKYLLRQLKEQTECET